MNPLVWYAMENIWSIPDRGAQLIVRPDRISPVGGYSRYGDVGWYTVPTPVAARYFHFYQIGAALPADFNLDNLVEEWVNFETASNQHRIEITIYTATGEILPKSSGYYRLLPDGNLIFAVEQLPGLGVDLNKVDLSFRLFKNPFFLRQDIGGIKTHKTEYLRVGQTSDIISMAMKVATIRQANPIPEQVRCIINGVGVSSFSTSNVKIGDHIEYTYDSSIYRVVDFPASQLSSFLSTRDGRRKYLLHIPVGWQGEIDHCYNVDIYVGEVTQGKWLFVNKDAADTLRNVSYKDYSLSCDYIEGYYSRLKNPTTGAVNLENIRVRLLIRQDGVTQRPSSNSARLEFLMKLPAAQQRQSLQTGGIWNAANMESHPYLRLMSEKFENITDDLAMSAIGYSQAAKVLSPAVVNSDEHLVATAERRFSLPACAKAVSHTAYRYDVNGTLIDSAFLPASSSVTYPENIRFLELIQGEPDNVAPFVSIGNSQIHGRLDELSFIYRFSDGLWADVSNNPNIETVSTFLPPYFRTTFNLSVITGGTSTPVRLTNPITGVVEDVDSSRIRIINSRGFIAKKMTVMVSDGVILIAPTIKALTVTSLNVAGDPVTTASDVALDFPLGEYDLWLNGKSLVENIDYRRVGNRFMVFNKKHLGDLSVAPVVEWRIYGKPKVAQDRTISWGRRSESGFVFEGKLSQDGQYDLYEHQNVRLSYNSGVVPFDKSMLIENSSIGILANGTPYELRQPHRSLAPHYRNTEVIHHAQLDDDEQRIKPYMTASLPEQTAMVTDFVSKYKLYSPFLGKILSALKSGNMTPSSGNGTNDDMVIRQIVQPYLWMYEFDPTNPANRPDLNFCSISPHWSDTPVSLSLDKYRFLRAVVRIFTDDIVSLTPSVILE